MTDSALGQPPLLEWAVAALTLPGQAQSGDLHGVVTSPASVLAAVVDGLGHGPEAALAARLAVDTLRRFSGLPVASLLERCHRALKGTRGAVMSLASLDSETETMTWSGVGDVEGLLLRADAQARPNCEALVARGGVVGYQLPAPRVSTLPIARGDMLIFATDGIRGGFGQGLTPSTPPQAMADHILRHHGRGTDDALVLVVRYGGRTP